MGLPLLSMICLALTDLRRYSLEALAAAEGATATEHWTELERRVLGQGTALDSWGLVWGLEERKGFWRRLVVGWVAKAMFKSLFWRNREGGGGGGGSV